MDSKELQERCIQIQQAELLGRIIEKRDKTMYPLTEEGWEQKKPYSPYNWDRYDYRAQRSITGYVLITGKPPPAGVETSNLKQKHYGLDGLATILYDAKEILLRGGGCRVSAVFDEESTWIKSSTAK